jgi:glycerate kinase
VEAAEAMAAGWVAGSAGDEPVVRPLADGGPGFVDAIAATVAGHRLTVPTVDPLGRRVTGEVFLVGDIAYVESAQACGLHLLRPGERDPGRATSYGVGLLLIAAMETGARTVVVGLGGSATNDAGAGMLAALDAAPVDAAGYALPYGAAPLHACAALVAQARIRAGVRLIAAADVDNPLIGPDGATSRYGPQKGVATTDVALLDAGVGHFADVLGKELPSCPPDLAAIPGGGAAGGLGAALLALGAEVVSGAALVRELVGFDDVLAETELVLTGEGSFDDQSLRGKVVAGVAAATHARRLPCVVIAGQVRLDPARARAAGVAETVALAADVGLDRALRTPRQSLVRATQRLASRWRG